MHHFTQAIINSICPSLCAAKCILLTTSVQFKHYFIYIYSRIFGMELKSFLNFTLPVRYQLKKIKFCIWKKEINNKHKYCYFIVIIINIYRFFMSNYWDN